MKKIQILCGSKSYIGELYDTPTASMISLSLPLSGKVQRWGDEIYFDIPSHVELDPEAREEVEPGELGFWPGGDAFCIFFGKTPASRDEKPRAASAVNVFGKLQGDLTGLKDINTGDNILVMDHKD